MSDNQNLDNIVDDNTDDDDNEDQLQMDDEEDEIPFDHDDFNKAVPSHQEPQPNVADELKALQSAIATLTRTVTNNQKRTHGETSGSIFQAKRNKKQIDEDILRNMEQRIAQLERSTQRLTNAILDREHNRDGNRNVSPPPVNRQPQVNNYCAFCNGDHWASECPQYPTLSERRQQCRHRNRCERCLREANIWYILQVDLQCFFCRRNRRTHLMNRHNSAFCPYQFPM
ncbi:hypothetical protein OSTOST_01992 [Ostertagia ostertagi]